jgi:hypothetical protein
MLGRFNCRSALEELLEVADKGTSLEDFDGMFTTFATWSRKFHPKDLNAGSECAGNRHRQKLVTLAERH